MDRLDRAILYFLLTYKDIFNGVEKRIFVPYKYRNNTLQTHYKIALLDLKGIVRKNNQPYKRINLDGKVGGFEEKTGSKIGTSLI